MIFHSKIRYPSRGFSKVLVTKQVRSEWPLRRALTALVNQSLLLLEPQQRLHSVCPQKTHL